MSWPAGPVFAWAAWLSTLATVQAVWRPDRYLPWALSAGAATAAWLLGLYLLARRRRAEGFRMLPDLSFSVVLLALGVAAMLNGAAFGLWLVLLGGGLVLVGLGGVVRELRAERQR